MRRWTALLSLLLVPAAACDRSPGAPEDAPRVTIESPVPRDTLLAVELKGVAEARTGLVDSVTFSLNGGPEQKLATGHPREVVPFQASGFQLRRGETNLIRVSAHGSRGRRGTEAVEFHVPADVRLSLLTPVAPVLPVGGETVIRVSARTAEGTPARVRLRFHLVGPGTLSDTLVVTDANGVGEATLRHRPGDHPTRVEVTSPFVEQRVTVFPRPEYFLTAWPDPLALQVGGTVQVRADVYSADGRQLSGLDVEFAASDTTLFTLSACATCPEASRDMRRQVTGRRAGEGFLVARYGGAVDTVAVRVAP